LVHVGEEQGRVEAQRIAPQPLGSNVEVLHRLSIRHQTSADMSIREHSRGAHAIGGDVALGHGVLGDSAAESEEQLNHVTRVSSSYAMSQQINMSEDSSMRSNRRRVSAPS
jgi:hypothetical protein